ncbi:MAG: ribonuclease HI family protein [Patescibacteria group bacterium]
MEKSQKVVTYTDGGSRGNPGPAALGVAICDEKGVVVKTYGEALGVRTNNEAEYAAIVYALKKLKQLYGKGACAMMHVEMRMDSQLAVKQLSGEYKMESEKLFKFFIDVGNLKMDFASVIFKHVPREQNKVADRMVNEALDNPKQSSLL